MKAHNPKPVRYFLVTTDEDGETHYSEVLDDDVDYLEKEGILVEIQGDEMVGCQSIGDLPRRFW